MRRLALLVAGGAVWLFLAAIPALADGGPHIAPANSGVSTLTADTCAGCHRAHTAQGAMLLAADDAEALCLTCHGSAGAGSAVDVENGIQYTTASRTGGTVLGALRGGGYINARIDSDSPSRVTYVRNAAGDKSQRTKVSVLPAGNPVTSAHIDFTAGVFGTGMAWGNGPLSATAYTGAPLRLECATCHNPHGNEAYRILRPIPIGDGNTGPFVEPTTGVDVVDGPPVPAGDTRNYTVIQTQGGTGTLFASQVLALPSYTNLMGDYFHRAVPWDPQVPYTAPPPAGVTSFDAPNGQPLTFNGQINAWCAQCHSRYLAATPGIPYYATDSGDAIFKYRHSNTSNKPCTTCHVAHGSNADMTGVISSGYEYPDGTASASSRLLKIDNRGTCQACHDPTETRPAGEFLGPVPAPYVP